MNPEVATVTTVSANVLIRNELANVDSLVQNLLDAGIDEIVFLDGGSTDGSWELLQAWREREPRIIPLRWPQPAGSEYKLGFKEVQRRNLMIEASSSSHILYIDADERISLDFKQKIPLASDCVAVSFTSFWDKRIRVNGPDDRVSSAGTGSRFPWASPEAARIGFLRGQFGRYWASIPLFRPMARASSITTTTTCPVKK
jgi:glycosyltransferase involved in cell wall biosynthesis